MKSEFSTCSQALAASHTPSNGSAQQELFAPSHFASETGSVKPSCESTGPTRQSTTMCEPSTLTENATSSRAATHASATVEQTPNEMAKACGRGHSDRSAGTDLFTLFEKMFLETSTREPLNRLKVTLSQKVMPSGRTLSVLRPSVPLPIDPGRGRWPTPTAQDAKNATMPPSQAHRNNGSIPCLLARMGFVGWVLNPRFYEELMMFPRDWTALEVSEIQSVRQSSSKSDAQS
jgi:hypothetical protein